METRTYTHNNLNMLLFEPWKFSFDLENIYFLNALPAAFDMHPSRVLGKAASRKMTPFCSFLSREQTLYGLTKRLVFKNPFQILKNCRNYGKYISLGNKDLVLLHRGNLEGFNIFLKKTFGWIFKLWLKLFYIIYIYTYVFNCFRRWIKRKQIKCHGLEWD